MHRGELKARDKAAPMHAELCRNPYPVCGAARSTRHVPSPELEVAMLLKGVSVRLTDVLSNEMPPEPAPPPRHAGKRER